MKIAHLSAEVAPFAKSGGLGDVVGALPLAQAALGHETTVWMPLYREVWRALDRLRISPGMACEPFNVELGYRSYQVGILRAEIPGSSVPVFFVGHDPLFDRDGIYAAGPDGRDDGLRRYALFVRAVMRAQVALNLVPDVIHAHDWHATLAPMILAWERPPFFERTASILTIHNLAYQGMYSPEQYVHLGLPLRFYRGVEYGGVLNLMKGGIVSAGAITAVSPTFAHEITTPDGGFGLDALLRSRREDLHGIVNGIDRQLWNPALDPKIPFNYDVRRLRRKRENRRALLSLAGMDKNDPGFVVGMVGRLTSQKGFDLMLPALPDLVGSGVRMIVLGSGESHLEGSIRRISDRALGRFWGYVGFNEELAHLVEAGVDAFLMPSRFEPCGLNQLYSLAYGTPPIVRRVGGLADTVVPFDGSNRGRATGFDFQEASPRALRDAVRWAQACYHDPLLWTDLARNGMSQDWSWERSATRYVDVYQDAVAQKRASAS